MTSMNSNTKSTDHSFTVLPNTFFKSLEDAHGTLPYNMTNDYMFRAVLQTNNQVLHGLICSLLHLREEDICSVEITNPIILGDSIDSKECRLDIMVLLNNATLINLEMQVANRLNWTNRSILYLCRSFDTPKHGQDYLDAMPVIHIGFLDYTLFSEYPEFYATYKLINVKNHHVYSDNLMLHVVDLSKIDLATEEDKEYHIDHWARLFKTSTWEELKMLASENKYLDEASKTIFRLSADEQIRKQCRDREEYYQDLRSYEREIEKMKRMIEEKDAVLSKTLSEKDATIQKLLAEINVLKSGI